MRAREFIIEGYLDAIAEFSKMADPITVTQMIEKFKQLVARNRFTNIAEKNIDYWRRQGWEQFSNKVTELESTATKTQVKRKKAAGRSITLRDDDQWLIVVPLDKESSCFYGRDTNWCTSKPLRSNFEEYFYNDQVTLIYAMSQIDNEHYAIAVHPKGAKQIFDSKDVRITDTEFSSMSGLDPDQLIAMAKNPTNMKQLNDARAIYQSAISTIPQMLEETPLNHTELVKLLSMSKHGEFSVQYIKKYAQEVGHPVVVPDPILISAFLFYEDPEGIRNPHDPQLVESIDYANISISTTRAILRDTPKLLLEGHNKLTPEQVQLLSIFPKAAQLYASQVIKGRWPQGEAAIATSAEYSYEYAKTALKANRFPAGEATIAKHSWFACIYAMYILKQPWPEAEPAIKTDPSNYNLYKNKVLYGPWGQGIKGIASDIDAAFIYAREILKGKFPEGEAILATDPEMAFKYANEITKDRFPAGEAAIGKDAEYATNYAHRFIKDRFPAGEAAITKNPRYLDLYAKYVIKKQSPESEADIAKNPILAKKYDERFGTTLAN